MNLQEAREMIPVFPRTGELGDVTIKLMRKQHQMISRRLKRRLRQVTAPLRRA